MEELNLKNRPDIRAILALPEVEFLYWYEPRYTAALQLLQDYELFASIPHLGYPDHEFTMEAMTHVGNHLETLQEGLRFLRAIRTHWLKKRSAPVKV